MTLKERGVLVYPGGTSLTVRKKNHDMRPLTLMPVSICAVNIYIYIYIYIIDMHEAYSESKYRFVVKKSSKVSYKFSFLSDSTFFKLFFHIFATIIETLIVAGHKFLYTLRIECGRLRC